MDARDISRLREEQLKALEDTNEKIDHWKRFRSDYKVLQDRLTTLPDKVSYDITVPFGSKAFMPGQLVHTNEILVLLGDDWFVERSAKQAVEIVERRIQAIDTSLSEFKQQKKLLQPRLEFTDELKSTAEAKGDLFEIQEDYDEIKETAWREQHKRNLKAARLQQRPPTKKESSTEGSKRKPKRERTVVQNEPSEGNYTSDEALWARLDELEKLEREQGELNSASDTEVSASPQLPIVAADVINHSKKKKVRWKDSSRGRDDETDDDNGDDDVNEAGTAARPSVIHFTHSQVSNHDPISQSSSNSNPTTPITSPADIFSQFGRSPEHASPKSILKSSKPLDQNSLDTDQGPLLQPEEKRREKTVIPGSLTAFSGLIVEKENPLDPPAPVADLVADQPKRVSRFKAQRQNIQHIPADNR